MRHLREHRVAVVVLAALSLVVLAACVPPPPPSSPASDDMVKKTNFVRGLNGLGQLSVDGGLQGNAQFHADRLAAGATSCGAPGALWHSSELGAWYGGHWAAENVACVPGCPTNADGVFHMWLNSPGHAANMLDPAYALTGVATACNGQVQMTVAHFRSG